MRRKKGQVSSDDDEPLSKKLSELKTRKTKSATNDDSSSESDIENYLQPADKIDLRSSFFNIQKISNLSIEKNEKTELQRNNDRDPESDEILIKTETIQGFSKVPDFSKFHFQQLQEYTRKVDEMKKCAEAYKNKQAANKQENISNLLAQGELKNGKETLVPEIEDDLHSSEFESFSESEKEGWEEVKEQQKEEESVIPKEGLQITVEMPGTIRKKKSKVDVMASIKRRINRIKKEHQILIHKVHLLCWIAHGNHVSTMISSPSTLALALSLVPSEYYRPVKHIDLEYLKKVLEWYRSNVSNLEIPVPRDKNLQDMLETQISKNATYDSKEMIVYIFVAILRSLGIQCRLVLSFQVEPLRPPDSELISLSTKDEKSKTVSSKRKSRSSSRSSVKDNEKDNKESQVQSSTNKKIRSKSTNENSQLKVEERKTRSKSTSQVKVEGKKTTSKKKKEISQVVPEEVQKKRSKSTSANTEIKSDGNKKTRSSSVSDKSKKTKTVNSKVTTVADIAGSSRTLRSHKKFIPQVDGTNDSNSDEEVLLQADSVNEIESPSNQTLKKEDSFFPNRHSKRLSSLKSIKYQDTDSEDEFTTRSPFSNKNKESPKIDNNSNLKKNKTDSRKGTGNSNDLKQSAELPQRAQRSTVLNDTKIKSNGKAKTPQKRRSGSKSEEDSDYIPEVSKKKRRESADDFAPSTQVTRSRRQTRKSISSDEERTKKKQGTDVWVEVFVESVKKWISVDVCKGQVNCINELSTRATQPIIYVVAWNNNGFLKDVTGRYCQNFNTVTRKLRVDSKWWEETLKPFVGRKTARDQQEDEELERQQLEKPLPKSIAEYKNHPLYVLKRHLLKFEALYPPDAPTLGFVRNEPVYSRQCVYTLHSRDIWLKKAKVVKLGEKPYKIVKARPKYDKLSNTIITDQLLEIFGPWQTEDYVPPTAENGVVPRNAFGNVDLFQPSMLPKKTVHLQLAGLNKVARRMNIDCAPAITGFDFHGGWSHPVYDGFVVCEEFADILVAAWELEQDEMEKREQERIDKRVYGNWRRLIRGLLITERLKAKYEFGEVAETKGKKKSKGGSKLVLKRKKNVKGSDSEAE